MVTEYQEGRFTNSQIINGIALGFSLSFFIASALGGIYANEWGHIFSDWYRILITPCPLVTDYFALGGLGAAFLNAGVCGLFCFFAMIFLPGESRSNTLAGFFLVIAHCFYGLNFLNMLPCFFAPFLYLTVRRLDYKSNLHICMFATSFGPFVSELLFRYTQKNDYQFGVLDITPTSILYAVLFVIALGFIIPAILPGASAWHKGYDLFNGGLAFGVFGFFAYNLLYKTMGAPLPTRIDYVCESYELHGHSYRLFANCYFILMFLICFTIGMLLKGNKAGEGIHHLIRDTGFRSDFAKKYGMPACLINIGVYGLFFLTYLNLVINFTEGAGFTGPTCGVMLASLTFTAMGQHPRNVWPILIGYQCLYAVAYFHSRLMGWDISWTVSTQGYINGVAFATGISPLVGRYGARAGIVAGFLCASMCTSTAVLHGGLVLYNGGFTAGLTVLILLPILEHYAKKDPRDEMKGKPIFDIEEVIMLNEKRRQKSRS